LKKHLLTVGFLATIIVSPAIAADLQVEAPELLVLPDPVSDDWTGLYAGLFGGYASGAVDTYTQGFLGSDVGVSGPMIGANVGVNMQLDSIMLGAEGDLAWAGIDGSEACDDDTFFTCGRSITWLSTIRGRAGVALDKVLIYATGGLAIGGVHATTEPTPANSDGEYSDTFLGWTLGAGAEMKVTDTISVRAEYAYTDLGTYGLPEGTIYSAGPDDVEATLHPYFHSVKLGLNFAF
jgi:outer membrane immunogenic protein